MKMIKILSYIFRALVADALNYLLNIVFIDFNINSGCKFQNVFISLKL